VPKIFFKQLLDEGYTFATNKLPRFSQKGSKKSPPSKVPIQTSSAGVPPTEGSGKGEYWVARKSIHGGKKEVGDATWEEFDQGLRTNHSQHEMEYTPSVQDANEVCAWNESQMGRIEGWNKVHAAIM